MVDKQEIMELFRKPVAGATVLLAGAVIGACGASDKGGYADCERFKGDPAILEAYGTQEPNPGVPGPSDKIYLAKAKQGNRDCEPIVRVSEPVYKAAEIAEAATPKDGGLKVNSLGDFILKLKKTTSSR